MSYTRIWFHVVWTTKRRRPLLSPSLRPKIFTHIRDHAHEKGIHLDVINGYCEHVHCLVALQPDQTISDVVQILKGESSFWINRNKLMSMMFAWQDKYFAVSVGESYVERVRSYIRNQEEHHRKKSFREEYLAFIERSRGRG
jgi:putative transposase